MHTNSINSLVWFVNFLSFFFSFFSFIFFVLTHSSSILSTKFTYRCVYDTGGDCYNLIEFVHSIFLFNTQCSSLWQDPNPKRSHPILQYINPQLLVYFRFHVRINCAVQTVNCDRMHWYVLNHTSRFITVNGNSSRWSQIISLFFFLNFGWVKRKIEHTQFVQYPSVKNCSMFNGI